MGQASDLESWQPFTALRMTPKQSDPQQRAKTLRFAVFWGWGQKRITNYSTFKFGTKKHYDLCHF